MDLMMAYGQFEPFIRNMSRVMGAVNTKLQRDLTLRTHVTRRFSMREVATLRAVDTTYQTVSRRRLLLWVLAWVVRSPLASN